MTTVATLDGTEMRRRNNNACSNVDVGWSAQRDERDALEGVTKGRGGDF